MIDHEVHDRLWYAIHDVLAHDVEVGADEALYKMFFLHEPLCRKRTNDGTVALFAYRQLATVEIDSGAWRIAQIDRLAAWRCSGGDGNCNRKHLKLSRTL